MTRIGKWAARINQKYANEVLVSFRKGNKVYCVINPSNWDLPNYLSVACCHGEDKFDYNVGRAIAIAKAFDLQIPKQ